MKSIILTFALILITFGFSDAQYSNKMIKAIKKTLGKDLKNYQFFSYPRNNYGVITSYEDKLNDLNFICDTWYCIGVNNAPTDLQKWLTVNDYVAEGNGAEISLTEKVKKKFALNAALPKIYNVIGVEGGFNSESITSTTITIGTAYFRQLRRDPIMRYLGTLSNDNSMKSAFNAGRLVYVVSDVVIKDLTITIEIKNGMDGDLAAKVSDSETKIFNNSELEVNMKKEKAGTYTFKVTKPVIVARLARKQTTAGLMEGDQYFQEWQVVNNLPLPEEN